MNEAEFEKLVAEIRPELVRIATRRAGRDQAEDGVQAAILAIWTKGLWKTASRETVAKRLRVGARLYGKDQMRGLQRLRTAQRNLLVLAHSGGKRLAPKGGADRQAEEIQRTAQRRQEVGQ